LSNARFAAPPASGCPACFSPFTPHSELSLFFHRSPSGRTPHSFPPPPNSAVLCVLGGLRGEKHVSAVKPRPDKALRIPRRDPSAPVGSPQATRRGEVTPGDARSPRLSPSVPQSLSPWPSNAVSLSNARFSRPKRPCPPTCPPKPNGRRWKPWRSLPACGGEGYVRPREVMHIKVCT
jgi:hypothetical protein